MKKITVFALMMLFLVGLVMANPVINTPTIPVVYEGNTLTFDVTCSAPDNGNSVFTRSLSQLVPIYQDNTKVTYQWITGYTDAGSYPVQFNVSDSNSTSSASATITVINTNRAPTANAGADQTVEINRTVTLDASGSSDPDGNTLTYTWTQVSGPVTIGLPNINAEKPTFTPLVAGTYVFNLTATDTGSLSGSDQVRITVSEIIRLKIIDLDVKVGSKTDSNIQDESDGYTIDRDAAPGDELTIDVEVENTFGDDDDVDITDVFMKVIIEKIDDGEDLEEETEEKDIKHERDAKFDVKFELPLKVDEGEYDILIEIEGEDENGDEHRIEKTLVLNIEKETHDIRIMRADLRFPAVSCGRGTNLDIEVLNLGSDYEEEIRITATNNNLGLDFMEWDDGEIELETGVDDDAEYSVSVPVTVDEDINPGDYPIEVRVYRDETRLEDTKTVTLTVEKCTAATTGTTTPPAQETQGEDQVDIIVGPSDEEDTTTPSEQYPVIAQVEEEGFFDSTGYMIVLGAALIVLVLLIIMIVALLTKKQ